MIDYTAETLRSDMIMLLTADLSGHPLIRPEIMDLLSEHGAAYAADLIASQNHTLARHLADGAGSEEEAMKCMQAAALAPLVKEEPEQP